MTCIVVKSGDHTPSVSILGVHFNNDVLVWSRRSNRLRRIELQLAHRVNDVGQSGVVGKAQQQLESVGPNLSGSGRITGNMLQQVRETGKAVRRSAVNTTGLEGENKPAESGPANAPRTKCCRRLQKR